MVRPGPKTTQEGVKTAVVWLLQEHPEGLNFNKIFKILNEEKVLGSFSVLSKAMKDLLKSEIVSYRDLEKAGYKIPKRIYTLTQKTRAALQNLEFQRPKLYPDIKTAEKRQQLKKIAMKLFADIRPSEAALLSSFLHNALQLTLVYEQMIHENGDPEGLWRLLLNKVFDGERNSMEKTAQQARDRKIPMDFKQELSRCRALLFRWADLLTVYFMSSKGL
jgi:DNA-binding PadR family transcriptional regulator